MGTLLREYFEGAGTRFLLESNVPLPLDDPDCAVLVLGGKAEIFAQRFQGGRPTEARIHLHTARPGDVLFGTSKSDEGLRLLAAGNLESHAVKLPFAELENQARKSPAFAEELRRNAERFISGTGAGTAAEIIPRPRINLDAESGASVLLDGSSVVAPRTGTVWVSKTRGTPPMFLGQEELILPEKLFFPLPSSCWITGAGESSLDFSDTSAVVNQGSLTASLSIWFSTLFSCLEFNHRMGLVDTLNLLEEKRTENESRLSLSVRRLASVLKPKTGGESVEAGGSPLFQSMCRLGNAQGIRFVQPGRERGNEEETPARIADMSGVRYREIRLENGWHRAGYGSMLCFLRKNNEPAAVIEVRGKGRVVVGPDGEAVSLTSRNAAELSDRAWVFYPPPPSRKMTVKEVIREACKGTAGDFRSALLTGAAAGLTSLVLPAAVAAIFNSIIPASDIGRLPTVLCAVVGAMCAAALLRVAGAVSILRMEARIGAHTETALWDRLIRSPLDFFTRYSAGNLASRCMVVQTVRESLSGGVLIALTSGVFSLFYLLYMGFLSPALALVSALLILMQGAATWGFTMFRLNLLREASRIRNGLAGKVLQFITGLNQLKSAGAESRAFGNWAEGFARQRSLQYRAFQGRNALRIFNAGFTVFALAVIFLVSGYFLQDMDTGTFVACYVAFGALQSGVLKIISSLTQIMAVLPRFERIAPILQAIPEEAEAHPDPGPMNGKIEITGLSFTYPGAARPALENINMGVSPGEFIALTGPSGSGKSTLLRLLAGLSAPDTGSICLDDKNTAEMNRRLMRKRMGIVLQDFGILPGTVRQTVSGDRSPTEDQLQTAVKIACLDREVRDMPEGLDSDVGRNGDNLSGGQRQKLMLARAVLSDPAILILDEATSALDNETQAEVMRHLEALNSTRIAAAHRLSTIRNADRILVLDKGRIVEEGDFRSLMDRKGLFHSMAQRQMV